MRDEYFFDLDLNQDFNTIKETITKYLDHLDQNRSKIIRIATSLYELSKLGERLERYKNHSHNLDSSQCEDINKFIEKSISQFLDTPMVINNIYYYNPINKEWVVVSPTGHLWLIYGTTETKIDILANFLKSLCVDNTNVIDLKSALDFVDQCVHNVQLKCNDKSVLTMILSNKAFIEQYQKVLNLIELESNINR